jgi:hypothetical protein
MLCSARSACLPPPLGCVASLHRSFPRRHFLDPVRPYVSLLRDRCPLPTHASTHVCLFLSSHVVLVAFVQPYPASGSGQPTLGRRQCARLACQSAAAGFRCAGGAARDRRADGCAGPAISAFAHPLHRVCLWTTPRPFHSSSTADSIRPLL